MSVVIHTQLSADLLKIQMKSTSGSLTNAKLAL